MTALEAPVAVLADVEAWQARDAYPDLVSGGGPVFGVARELEAGGWRLHRFFCNDTPQGARESMSVTFRKLAQAAERRGAPPTTRSAWRRRSGSTGRRSTR